MAVNNCLKSVYKKTKKRLINVIVSKSLLLYTLIGDR